VTEASPELDVISPRLFDPDFNQQTTAFRFACPPPPTTACLIMDGVFLKHGYTVLIQATLGAF
jgi:hypothetical protein